MHRASVSKFVSFRKYQKQTAALVPEKEPSVRVKIYFVFTCSQSDRRENLCSQVVLVNGVKAKVFRHAEIEHKTRKRQWNEPLSAVLSRRTAFNHL